MPLTPLQMVKSGSREDARIGGGSIVEYEQHGKIIIAAAISERKGKWSVLNQAGAEVHLPANRLYLLPGKVPEHCKDAKAKVAFLSDLAAKAAEAAAEIALEPVWEVLLEQGKEIPTSEIVELLYPSDSTVNHLAVRLALLNDRVFFRRKKNTFEPRAADAVAELKVKAQREDEQRAWQESILKQAVHCVKNRTSEGFTALEVFEDLAALGKTSRYAKDYRDLLDMISAEMQAIDSGGARSGTPAAGKMEAKAFELLVRIGHFSPDENLMLLRLSRPRRFSAEALGEVAALERELAQAQAPAPVNGSGRRLTVTIDGAETRDFDDALSIERNETGWRIGVHISDVAAYIKPGSALEADAFRRGISIYCPDEHIPMMPPPISENALSLIEGTIRPVLSMYVQMSPNFAVVDREIRREHVAIDKRLTYEQADELLCGQVGENTDLELRELLSRLWDAAAATESRRMQAGALQLNRREMYPHIMPDGRIVLEEPNDDNPSRKLVSELMILANETIALFARDRGIPMVFRGQEPPDVDIDRETAGIPDGPAREYYRRGLLKRSLISYDAQSHFGLGLPAYVQATSPIRRAVDLLNQRQIVSQLESGKPLYSEQELSHQLALLELGLDEASQIQRGRTRYWLMKYLLQEKIVELDAVVIKVDGPRPLAELDILNSLQPFHPIAPRGSDQNYIGKRVRLRIDSIDPRQDMLVLREIPAAEAAKDGA